MRKRTFKIAVFFSVLLLFALSVKTNIVVADSTPKPSTVDFIDDPDDDVKKTDTSFGNCEPTDLHNEINIDNMTRNGQIINITFIANVIADSNHIYIFYMNDPALSMYWAMWNAGFGIIELVKGATGEHWDGAAWSFNLPVTIGALVGNNFNIDIPVLALTLDNTWDWYIQAQYYDGGSEIYSDWCDDMYSVCDEDENGKDKDDDDDDDTPATEISGYDTALLIITSICTIGLIYVIRKKK